MRAREKIRQAKLKEKEAVVDQLIKKLLDEGWTKEQIRAEVHSVGR